MMKEHLYLLKFSLKLLSGWSVLIALSLVLALEGTHFFWFACPHVIFNKYYRYLCPILLSSVTDCKLQLFSLFYLNFQSCRFRDTKSWFVFI